MSNKAILVIQRPEGDAPEWVRDEWIGLTLPLALDHKQVMLGASVLNTPKSWLEFWWMRLTGQIWKAEGYAVVPATAVAVLETRNPAAANWWRENTPDLLGGENLFIFDVACCRPVE
jgi:hypothetical protein